MTNTTTEPTPARSGATPEPGEKRVRFPRTRAYIQRHEFLASVTKVISGTGLAQLIAALATLYVTHHIDPAEPVNILILFAFEFIQEAAHRCCLNDIAFQNM